MHKRIRTPIRIALLAVLAAQVATAATLYRWVDANGITHWSDRPVEGSQPVDVGAPTTVRGGMATRDSARANTRSSNASAPVLYSSLAITAPQADAVLYDTGGTVECSVQLTPPLAPGHTLWFELDGQRTDSHGATTLSLPAPRGEHQLRVSITDSEGRELATSAAQTFYVRQASILKPPVGPALQKPH